MITSETSAVPGNEPGQIDNRLSLNPNDERWSSEVNEWEDGVEYVLKEVRVIQISPGEYEVLSVQMSPDNPAPAENNRRDARPPKTPLAAASHDRMGRPNAALQGRLGLNR